MGRMTEAAHFRTETSSFWNAVSSMVSKVPKVSLVSMVSMVSEVSMVSKVFMDSKVSKASKPFMLSMVSKVSKDSKVSMVSKVSMHLSLSSQCRWTKSHLCLCSKWSPFRVANWALCLEGLAQKMMVQSEIMKSCQFFCVHKKKPWWLWLTNRWQVELLRKVSSGCSIWDRKNGCWMGQNPVAWFLHQNSWDLWRFISVEMVLVLKILTLIHSQRAKGWIVVYSTNNHQGPIYPLLLGCHRGLNRLRLHRPIPRLLPGPSNGMGGPSKGKWQPHDFPEGFPWNYRFHTETGPKSKYRVTWYAMERPVGYFGWEFGDFL